MCSTASAGRPPTTAVAENRIAATVPGSMRPAATSSERSASHTCRSNAKSSIAAPSPSATSMRGALGGPRMLLDIWRFRVLYI